MKINKNDKNKVKKKNKIENNDNIEIIKLLIDAGANIYIRDRNDRTALTRAIEYGNTECVCILLKAGLNLDFKMKMEKLYNEYVNHCNRLKDLTPLLKDNNILTS